MYPHQGVWPGFVGFFTDHNFHRARFCLFSEKTVFAIGHARRMYGDEMIQKSLHGLRKVIVGTVAICKKRIATHWWGDLGMQDGARRWMFLKAPV
ncbi:hypothetical protein D3C87_1290810 [compost metagenome]